MWGFLANLGQKLAKFFGRKSQNMKLHSTYLFRVSGISGLPESATDWVVWKVEGRTATLTTDIGKYAEIVDRRNAIAEGLLTAFFQGDERPVAERIAAKMAAAQDERAKKYPGGTFLIFQAEEDAPELNLSTSREDDDFIVAFDAVDRKALEQQHQQDLKNCVAAVGLLMDDQVDHAIVAIGHASHLSGGEGSKPIFSFTAEAGSLRASLSRVISKERLEEAAPLVDLLRKDAKVGKIVDLYLQSIGQKKDDFRAFLSGWTAMEIFIQSTFKLVYGPQWFEAIRTKMPPSAAPYFKRVEAVMSDKHRLIDKFVVIATSLSPDTADPDVTELANLKEIRDGIAHGAADLETYPAERAQRLLRRYLELHLKRET